MKRILFFFFIILFLFNPAHSSAALWEYSAYGEIQQWETDKYYTITGNVLIDDTPKLTHEYFDYNIFQYALHITEQWGPEQYYFYGSSGAFRVHYYPNHEFEDFTWGFTGGEGDFEGLGGGFGWRFYDHNGSPWDWSFEGYMTLAPEIDGYVHMLWGGEPNFRDVGGNLYLTRTGLAQVPEPATGIFFAIGIASMIFWRRELR